MTSSPGGCVLNWHAWSAKQLIDERKTLHFLAAGYSVW